MPKFRKRPLVIEAMQVPPLEAEIDEAFIAFVDEAREDFMSEYDGSLSIMTPEGIMTARPGDWIIRGIKGEFYPCRSDVFDATYDAVAPTPTSEQIREWAQLANTEDGA